MYFHYSSIKRVEISIYWFPFKQDNFWLLYVWIFLIVLQHLLYIYLHVSFNAIYLNFTYREKELLPEKFMGQI